MKYSLDTNTITELFRKQPNVIANMERAIDNDIEGLRWINWRV